MKRNSWWLLASVLLAIFLCWWFQSTPLPNAAREPEPDITVSSEPGATPAQVVPKAGAGRPQAIDFAQVPQETQKPENPVEVARAQYRSKLVGLYVHSEVRDTPECREIVALVRRSGMEPWAIAPAYHLAYEMAKERAFFPPPMVEFLEREKVQSIERMTGVKFDSVFLEALRGIAPTQFMGHAQSVVGDYNLDKMTWENVE